RHRAVCPHHCSLPDALPISYGVLHPSVTRAMGLKGAVVAAEIFLDAIPVKKAKGHMREAFAPPALQAVNRDFAFIVDADLPAGEDRKSTRLNCSHGKSW